MKAKKICKIILVGLLSFVLFILLTLRIGVTVKYWDFFRNAEGDFWIPGLMSAYVPQGFDYMADRDTYLMAGYMSDGSPSRVYVRSEEGTHYVLLYREDGSAYVEHAGGIVHFGDFVYLPGSTGVDVFSMEEILNSSEATLLGTIETGHDMAYCTFYNGYLLAGNFYYPEHYETPANQRIKTPAGDENTAIMTVYRADETNPFGLEPIPVAAISTPGRVQGMCFLSDDELVLSTSWSLTDSNMLFYRVDTDRVGTIELLAGEVPLYYLDSANLVDTVVMPPMSEELVYRDGKIYVMYESACNKYIYGKFIRGYQVFAYEVG